MVAAACARIRIRKGCGNSGSRIAARPHACRRCPEGATPEDLLHRGVYSEIAVPLKGGPWREASMALLSTMLGMSKEEV